MIHARTDYDRFQEPHAKDGLATDVGFLLSAHESGETLSPAIIKAMRDKLADIPRPAGDPIANDEPVMLFRAKDKLAPRLLLHYAELLMIEGADRHMIEAVIRQMRRMVAWQDKHGNKSPDMPADAVR